MAGRTITQGRAARFLATESGLAVLIAVVVVIALALANLPFSDSYLGLWHVDVSFDAAR